MKSLDNIIEIIHVCYPDGSRTMTISAT